MADGIKGQVEIKVDQIVDLGAALAEIHRHIEAMFVMQRFDSAEINRSAERAKAITDEIIRRSKSSIGNHQSAISS